MIGQVPRKHSNVHAGGLLGELREKGQDWAEGEAELCAALIGSQPGKLKRQVAFQMSQIQARGHMAL